MTRTFRLKEGVILCNFYYIILGNATQEMLILAYKFGLGGWHNYCMG